MNKNKFLEVIEEQFEEIEIGTLTMETSFKEIEEWDSLVALSVIAALDSEFNLDVNAEILENAETIEDLYNFFQN